MPFLFTHHHGTPEFPQVFWTIPTYLTLLLLENCCFTGSAVGPVSHQNIFLMTIIFFCSDFKHGWRLKELILSGENKASNKLQSC